MRRAIIIASVFGTSAIAHAWPLYAPADPMIADPADEEPDPEEPDPSEEPDPPEEPDPKPKPEAAPMPKLPDDIIEKLDDLEERSRKLEKGQRVSESTKDQVAKLQWLPGFLTAYIDVGAFVVGGNGSGIRSDFLHRNYPEYRNTISGQWVFMGDAFATAINTLGEPADTAASREVATDTVNSSGRASFIVNTLGLALSKQVYGPVSVTGLVQFLPRPGPDIVDVPLAHIDFRPNVDFLGRSTLLVEVGKIDSVLGVEYRYQDAPRRVGITPSLIARYTTGRPTGIDARLVKDVGDGHKLSISTALINGDNFDERFEPKTELRSSRYPTMAGHLQWNFPIGNRFELGVSGAYGAQDAQANRDIHQWHYGFDVVLDVGGWEVSAELVKGKQPGSTSGDLIADQMLGVERASCDLAPCLDYKGAYLFVDRRVRHWLIPYARVDWRDATHRDGAQFLYEARSVRATVGTNFAITSRIRAKIEYSKNHELGIPNFPHDVLTSSLVVATD